MKINPNSGMENQKHFLARRHTEVYTWFRHFRIDNFGRWSTILFYYDGHAWLWFMIVQLLHLILERCLTFSQHAQEWIFGVWVKWRKHYVALLVLASNLKEDQSAIVPLVHHTLESVSAVHCQGRNEIKSHRKGIRDWHTRNFLSITSLS